MADRSRTRRSAPRPVEPPRPLALPDALEPVPPPDDLVERAAALGLAFEPGDVERLGTLLAGLTALNEIMNLTRIVEPEAMWERHVLDSLSLLPVLRSVEASSLLDVGSGGGLPGLPLAIAAPDLSVTLLEATEKKVRAQRLLIDRLGLPNVRAVHERAETAAGHARSGTEAHRAAYDAVIARALGPLPVLLELTVPFARVGGIVLVIKGERAEAEIAESKAALHALHASVAGTVVTPTGTIVVIEKRRTTPRIYPRRPGEPKRAPLRTT